MTKGEEAGNERSVWMDATRCAGWGCALHSALPGPSPWLRAMEAGTPRPERKSARSGRRASQLVEGGLMSAACSQGNACGSR